MSTTPEQIDLWRAAKSERPNLEFKEAKTQFDNRKLYKYCVAIANEGGGHLLLGIADQPPRPVVGSAGFNDPVEMAAKLFTAIGFRVDIEEVNHPDGRVVVFHIPSRPQGTAYAYDGAYLMRVGEELQPMTEDQLRKIFAERQPDWLEAFARMGLAEEQGDGLTSLKQQAEKHELPLPTYTKEGDSLVLTIYRTADAATKGLDHGVLDSLHSSERKGWEFLASRTGTTQSEYARELVITPRTAQRHLTHFVELGLLKRLGSGPATEYLKP